MFSGAKAPLRPDDDDPRASDAAQDRACLQLRTLSAASASGGGDDSYDAICDALAQKLKTKDDGTRKRRLIVNLKRSGRNALAYVAERVVLPRLQDAVFMMLMIFD